MLPGSVGYQGIFELLEAQIFEFFEIWEIFLGEHFVDEAFGLCF